MKCLPILIFASFCINYYCIASVIKFDKLEKTKQLFRNVLNPNEIEEIASRIQKIKSLRNDVSKQPPSASVAKKSAVRFAKNDQDTFENEQSPFDINKNLGLDDILYDGDVLLTPEQLDHLIAVEEENQKESGHQRRKRQAIAVNSRYHIFDKTKPIFYNFNNSFANPEYRQMFREAMDFYNAYSCLNITEGIGEQQIHVVSENGCWSYLGYAKNPSGQYLSIGPGCERFGTMGHEMGHALGFHHTQRRHDRDNYIKLRMDACHPYYEQYRKIGEEDNNNFGLPYDLGSIMHYGSTPPYGSMEAIDQTKKYSIGATDKVAFSDFKMLNALYSCQESCPSSPACKNQGYGNPKNCNVCVCPRGFQGSDCSLPQFSENTNRTCGGILNAQIFPQTFNGFLHSYSTSTSTRNLSTCYWHIKAPAGKEIRVKFNLYSGSESSVPCSNFGLEVRVDNFETVGARVCHPDMVDPALEYEAPSNYAIIAAFTKYYSIQFGFSFWFVEPTPVTTTPPPPPPSPSTTVDPRPFKPLNCSGAMDLVFVIDASDTMTAERLEIVKSQLITAIDENGIKWDNDNYDDVFDARVGIILSTGLYPGEPTMPFRYLDMKGCSTYYSDCCTPTIHTTNDLKKAFQDITFEGGKNNIALCMDVSLKGDYSPKPHVFGTPYFNAWGDRPSAPNAMIVISGVDTSNVTRATSQLKLFGVQIFSIGFDDLTISQLQAISGNPATAFSTTPENLANTIKQICTTTLSTPTTISAPATTPKATISSTTTTTPVPATTSTTTTPVPTTTVKPSPVPRLNCSGAMDLVFVIDASDTMSPERLEIVKSQLLIAVDQNGIKFQPNNNDTARVGIIVSASVFFDEKASPHRYVDFTGFVDNIFGVPRYIVITPHFKQAIRDIPFFGGINDIGLSMNLSLHGDYQASPDFYFGKQLFGGEGDRQNVPNAMIVISGGTNTTNVGVSTRQLRDAGVQVYSIGFDDLTISQLQEISGNPQTAFSTTPENLANTIKQICTEE